MNIDATQACKNHAFKIALVNKFCCETFNEFVFDLQNEVELASKCAAHVTVHGHDPYDHKFAFYITSLQPELTGEWIIVGINYKWDKSSNNPSNWHEMKLSMHNSTYASYKRDAIRIYKKNKPHDDTKPVDPAFEQWKKENPLAYEIIFTLISYYGKKHGRPAASEMYFIKHNFKDRVIGSDIYTGCAGIHCPKVNHFKIKDIYTLSECVRIELDDMTYTDDTGTTRKIDCTYTASVIKVEYSIVQKISSDVDAAYDEKCGTDKPTYKKPGITYQHASTAKPGSTETQKVIERLLKNSFYGTQGISLLSGKIYCDTTAPWTTTNPDLDRNVIEYSENDAKAVSAMYEVYEELNKEKETKEMKKLIINHYAVVVLIGEEMKTVVKILDPDTKEERGPWNTKLAVVSAIAKSFEHTRDGKHSTCYKLYEMLNTIKKPTNATIDFVADEMYQNGKRLKNYKWYQEAIKVKRPAPGKSVVIVMEDK